MELSILLSNLRLVLFDCLRELPKLQKMLEWEIEEARNKKIWRCRQVLAHIQRAEETREVDM